MLTVIAAMFGLAAALIVPVLVLVGLLTAIDRIQRQRMRVVARQVAVTDAIHREFGAVVAPVVRKRPWGPWTVFMTLPPDGWAQAGSLASIAHDVVAASEGQPEADHIRVVFAPREGLVRMA
jgi:hypothetical protein